MNFGNSTNDPLIIPALGVTLAPGEAVAVPDALAAGLLLQGGPDGAFFAADTAAADAINAAMPDANVEVADPLSVVDAVSDLTPPADPGDSQE